MAESEQRRGTDYARQLLRLLMIRASPSDAVKRKTRTGQRGFVVRDGLATRMDSGRRLTPAKSGR